MAQRKREKRPASTQQSERARLDEDGHERPGPHADVIFVLEPVVAVTPEFKRRRGFWTKLTGRAHGVTHTGSEAVES